MTKTELKKEVLSAIDQMFPTEGINIWKGAVSIGVQIEKGEANVTTKEREITWAKKQ